MIFANRPVRTLSFAGRGYFRDGIFPGRSDPDGLILFSQVLIALIHFGHYVPHVPGTCLLFLQECKEGNLIDAPQRVVRPILVLVSRYERKAFQLQSYQGHIDSRI